MSNPQLVENKPLSLVDVQEILTTIEKRDQQLSYNSNKVKEYLNNFKVLSKQQKDDLCKQLESLNLTRLKEEHFVKIIDFLPQTLNDLKIILQANNVTLPKKDQESIVNVVKEFVKEKGV